MQKRTVCTTDCAQTVTGTSTARRPLVSLALGRRATPRTALALPGPASVSGRRAGLVYADSRWAGPPLRGCVTIVCVCELCEPDVCV